jgi:hypothetical protein
MRVTRRLIVSHARDEAYLPLTRVILAKLGYALVSAEEWAALPGELAERTPDLRIVDERRLGEIPEDESPSPPTIVLTGRHGVTGADARIVGAVRKPAGLHELYRLIQLAGEERPRSVPRVPTYLSACCSHGGREWQGAVLSLSENGCLLRSPEPVALGSELELRFELPGLGLVATRAESAYQLVPDLGLVFCATPAAARHAIVGFVEQTLSVI